ncbi:MAG TPA: amidase [Opitutaceae bacterium]|nr:amidase [Opitutaceae bacterium]
MTIAAWRALAPAAAAAEFGRRLAALPPAQRRAAIAAAPSAEELEQRFAAAPRGGRLGGSPALVKDLFDTAGEETRAGSTFLPELRPSGGEDGTLAGAWRAAGVVLAGKTHMVEFAYGLTGENAHYGDCVSPRAPERTSGGSSSGSAVAVAAGLVPLAAASDTGGSVRVPAAFCGVYGMRLTPGHRWIRDAVPLAPSMDAPGWFTACAEDMRTTLEVFAPAPAAGRTPRGRYFAPEGLDPEVAAACGAAAAAWAPAADARLGRSLAAGFSGCAGAYQAQGGAEAWRYHQRWFERCRDRYDPRTRARLEAASRLTEAEIAAAWTVAERVRRTWEEYFGQWDFLVMPATPCPALRPEEFTQENRMRLLALTAPASLAGLPALTLPIALDGGMKGLTGGLQVVARRAEDRLFGEILAQNSSRLA